MRHRLFVYGTLQLPERVHEIIGRTLSGPPALLPDYRCGLVARADFPGIVPSATESTPGCLLSGLTQRELSLLDDYEGELYRRVNVTVKVDGKPVRAWVYVIVAWAWERVTGERWTIHDYRNRTRKTRFTY